MKLKTWMLAAVLGITALASGATNDLSGLLQKGLFEEEANRDLTAAIADYQSLAAAFDKDRQLAATAVFRLGECYRKLGKTNEAVLQYQRIVREFSDQQTLATLSVQNLTGLNAAPKSAANAAVANEGNASSRAELEANASALSRQLDRIRSLSAEDRRIYVQQDFPNPVLTKLMEDLNAQQQQFIETKLNYSPDHPIYKGAVAKLEALNEMIDAQISGVMRGLQDKINVAEIQLNLVAKTPTKGTSPSGVAGTPIPATTDEEDKQIRIIEAMIQNSPDLINSPDSDGKTPLILAAAKGQLVVAKYLLDHGADVNGLSRNHGSTPLCAAAENGRKTMTELLLARGADVTGRGLNPLFIAVMHGFTGVAEVLIANKADVNLPTGTDTSGRKPLQAAAGGGKPDLIQLLLAHGADVNAEDSQGFTPLAYAVREGETAAVKALLAAKAAVDAPDHRGNTPLHDAADLGRADIVTLLLGAGAAVDPVNNLQWTPLFDAVANGQVEAARVLLAHKANPNAKGLIRSGARIANHTFTGMGENPQPVQVAIELGKNDLLKLLLDAGADANADNPLFFAVDRSQTDAVVLLLGHGANPNVVVNGSSPLYAALQNGRDRRIVSALLEKSADPNAKGSTGYFPLALTHDPEIGGWLVQHHADMNARLPEGLTAVMSTQDTNYLKFLLEAGAKADLQDTNGNTALHYAVRDLSPERVVLLLANKANPNIQNSRGLTPLDNALSGTRNILSGIPPNALAMPAAIGADNPEAQKKIVNLLTQAGGQADLPKRNIIEVRRASHSVMGVTRDTAMRNRYTLLEIVAEAYGLITGNRSGDWNQNQNRGLDLFGRSLRFPDFKHVVVYRRAEGATNQTAMKIDLEKILNTGECSQNMTMEWGDIIEIPQTDHPVDLAWPGLSNEAITTLTNCTSRTVTVKIKNEQTTLPLASKYSAPPGVDPSRTRVSFMLRSVLDDSKLLRVSSDLSRVKVTRIDPVTKKTVEWVIDCNDPDQQGLWLRDGDVIEVPEK